MAHAFAQALMKNQTLLSLDLSILAAAASGHFNEYEPAVPITIETVIELARFLETSALERLTINEMNNDGFKALILSLPKTLIHLDLSDNRLDESSISTLCSYLKSKGNTLKELILDSDLENQYFQVQQLSTSSTVKILNKNDWQASSLRNEEPSLLDLQYMSDSSWSELLMALTKDDTICRAMHLVFKSEVDQKQLTYVKTLLDNQFRLKSLIITGTDNLLDLSIQRDLFQRLKENNSIIDLELHFKIDSNVFNEFVDLLTSKTSFIRLALPDSSNVSDKEAIMLSHALKNNTVLRSLTINQSQICDIGFEAFLSSLPNSLSELIMNNNQITEKSLPSLLAIINDSPTLKHISLRENRIRSNCSTEINVLEVAEKIVKIADANQCILNLEINDKVTLAIAESTGDYISFLHTSLEDDDVLGLHYELKKMLNRNWSLDFSYNRALSSVGYRYLTDILSSTINIVALSLKRNQMNEEARTSFLNGLSKNRTLKNVIICENTLNSQDMEYIGRFIQKNPILKQIDLHGCEIDDDGAIHLAKYLPACNLESLELSQNSISDRGCASLLSSIPSTLLNLSLRGNQVTKSSLQTILTFLDVNQTLKNLTIRNNPILEETIYEKIYEAAKQNNICEIG
ncbi:unnamed protein product [Rotaria sp. Silwood1]|nr:unnamed protein product [Rotaria sp. Silwood1]CAF3869647.1 unnamed protein product [Rotaria sp. Silwood1]